MSDNSDQNMDEFPIIVQNAGNTCYIDSLLVSLFYKEESGLIDKGSLIRLLETDPKTGDSVYLQEFIKFHFIDCINDNKSVLEDTMNTLRHLLFTNSWKEESEIFGQQDVTEFYTYLVDLFNGPLVETMRTTISEGLPNDSDNGQVEKLPFIPLSLPDNHSQVRIMDLLNSWLNDNVSNLKREIYNDNAGTTTEDDVNALNIYSIVNIPYMLGLGINRFKNIEKRDDTDVIIQRKITPSNNLPYPLQQAWTFRAAICHEGDSPKSGHYYCIVAKNNKFYLFDDLQIPSIYEIRMDDPSITAKIKKNVVFILYRLKID
jgi:ubiquitin C-terminal hydrolase